MFAFSRFVQFYVNAQLPSPVKSDDRFFAPALWLRSKSPAHTAPKNHVRGGTTLKCCSSRPEVFESDDDRREFTDFIEKLSNATFENYDQLPMNRTFDIDSNQYMELLWNLSFIFEPELNSGSTHKLYLQDTITELGICYTVNSKIAVYNSYR